MGKTFITQVPINYLTRSIHRYGLSPLVSPGLTRFSRRYVPQSGNPRYSRVRPNFFVDTSTSLGPTGSPSPRFNPNFPDKHVLQSRTLSTVPTGTLLTGSYSTVSCSFHSSSRTDFLSDRVQQQFVLLLPKVRPQEVVPHISNPSLSSHRYVLSPIVSGRISTRVVFPLLRFVQICPVVTTVTVTL